MTDRGRAWALLAPALCAVAALLVLPLATTAWLSLAPNPLVPFEGPGVANYRYLFGKAYYADAMARTLRISLAVTGLTLVVGYAAALALRKLAADRSSTLILCLAYPVLTGPLIVVLGWMILLSDGGPVIRPLVQAGWLAPLKLIGTETAVVIGLTHFTLPFVVLTLYAALRTIPESLVEAAMSLGAGRAQVLFGVLLPLSVPGIVSAAVIAFSLAASAYVSPHYLGGPTQLVLTTMVGQFILGSFNAELAAAAAMILLAGMTVVVVLISRAGARWRS